MPVPARPSRRIPARRLLAAVAAVAALGATAACGSDSGGGTTAPAKPAASSGGSGSTAVPSQDVVSSIAEDPALHAELPAAVRSSGSLTLGTPPDPGTVGLPHGGTVDGKEVGLDVDLRAAVAKLLGVKLQVEHGTFASIIPGVQNGKYDIGYGNFGVTKAREQVVDFATYLNDGQSFLGADTVPVNTVKTLTDLCGYTVATSPGSTFQQILTDGAGKCAAAGKKPYTVQYFSDSGPIFLGLANGKVDIYFGPTLALKYDAVHVAHTKYLGQISSTPVGFTTAKGSPLAPVLADAVNKLIADGSYARIFAKWSVPGTAITHSQVNPPATL
ncbi:ABC transporter substrate-binding protein [Actinacidiphila guanduensis]|uniref:Amino acid ABC transporter substrate-binding protein, PAAT family n=1 Tax=Actinacidiphila guanduensis TaxID=310781 RepID=A0A1H0HNL8_9ACTN|nr:ABC transporter substrate-binding protein [Actinacidiphila guanduensis]SDO20720.1 amino acid ABC transporter substrate-binding protein, PAAT family [Actinacidiphila guanduensis]